MKVFLLQRDRDFQVKPELHDAVFAAMHSSNPFALDNVKRNLERERARSARFVRRKPTTDETLTQDLELTTLWRRWQTATTSSSRQPGAPPSRA